MVYRGLLLAIIILALVLRLYGITAVKNVDEPNIINRAVLIADGQRHIPWYNWPGQSLMRINAAIFKDYAVVRNLSVQQLYQQHRWQLTTLAHLVTVLFSVVALIFIFLIGKQLYSVNTGLLAALFLAVSYLFTINSRWATPDVPMTAMFLISIYASLRLLEIPFTELKQRRWWYILGGGAIGFALATKYTGALAVVPLVMAHVLGLIESKKKLSVSSAFLSVPSVILAVVFVHTLFNPFAIGDWRLIIHDVMFEAKPIRLGADWGGASWPFFRNLWLYISSSLQWNGTMISLMAYAAMMFAIIKDHKRWQQHCILLSFFGITLVGLSSLGLHWSRWAVPLCPIIALYAAYGVMRAGMIGLIIIMIIPQLILSWISGYSAQHDLKTIDLMSEYIQKNISASAVIAADTYYLDIGSNYPLQTPKHKLYNKTVADYRAAGVEYVVVKPKRLVAAQKQPEKYAAVIQFFNDLDSTAIKIYSITAQPASLVTPTDDWKVYQWLFSRPNSIDGIKGTELELYRL